MKKRYQATCFKGSEIYIAGQIFDNVNDAEGYCELRNAWLLRNDEGGIWSPLVVECLEEGDPMPPIPKDKVRTVKLSQEEVTIATNLYLLLHEAVRKNRNELFKGATASRMYDCIMRDVEATWSDFRIRNGV